MNEAHQLKMKERSKCYKPPKNFSHTESLAATLITLAKCFWPWIFPLDVVPFQRKEDGVFSPLDNNTGEWI